MPLADAHAELLEALIAQPREPEPGSSPSPTRARRSRWGIVPRLTVAVAVVFAALMAVLSLTGGSGDKSGTVWAAELVRFAEASPLVLLDVDGWRVEYADEQSRRRASCTSAAARPRRRTPPRWTRWRATASRRRPRR